jgi:hypothetical protein
MIGGMQLPILFLIPFAWIFAALGPRQALKSNPNVRLWFAVLALMVIWFGGAVADLLIMGRTSSGEPPDAGWGGMVVLLHDLPIWLLFFGPSIPALISVASCCPRNKTEEPANNSPDHETSQNQTDPHRKSHELDNQ